MSTTVKTASFYLFLLMLGVVSAGCRSSDSPGVSASGEAFDPCEVSADCAAGLHCALGACVSSCSDSAPCPNGLACTTRGACTPDGGRHRDAPPSAEPQQASVTASPEFLFFGEGASEAAVTLTSQGSGSVNFRLSTDVDWLSVPQEIQSVEGQVEVPVALIGEPTDDDRGFAAIRVISDSGIETINVSVEQGIAGIFAGEMRYTHPRTFGSAPLRVLIESADAGQLALRVIAAGSPTFPGHPDNEARQQDLRVLLVNDGTGVYAGELTQVLFSNATSRQGAGFDRALKRTVSVSLAANGQGALEGTFEESWEGLLPQPVSVSGTLRFWGDDFEDGDPTAVELDLAPQTPAFSPVRYDYALAVSANGCLPYANSISTPAECFQSPLVKLNTITCAAVVGGQVPAPEVGNAVVVETEVPGGESAFVELAEVCEQELAANPALSADTECAHLPRMRCAQALNAALAYAPTSAGGGGSVTAAERSTAANEANAALAKGLSAYLVVINEYLVKAFRAPYDTGALGESSPTDLMRAAFAKASETSDAALTMAFTPVALDALAGGNNSERLTISRVLQVMSRHERALGSLEALRRRAGTVDAPTLQREAAFHAQGALARAVGVAHALGARVGNRLPEETGFTRALSNPAERFTTLAVGSNPLGMPDGVVEFLYDERDVGPNNGSNFLQVINKRSEADLQLALEDERNAIAFIDELDTNTEDLTTRLEQATRSANDRLIELCGAAPSNPSAPDIDSCGQAGGALRVAQDRVNEEYLGLQRAETQLDSLEERIEIEARRADAQIAARDALNQSVADTNASILQQVKREERAKRRKGFWRRIGNLITAGAPVVIGIVATVATGGAAAPVAGLASAATGAAPAIIDVATVKYDNAASNARERRVQLEQEKELARLITERNINVIDNTARLENLMVERATLEVEFWMAAARLSTGYSQLASLHQEVAQEQADLEFWQARLLSGNDNDATARVFRDRAVARALRSRERALRAIFLAARAFEYETNTELPEIESRLVPAVRADEIERFATCLRGLYLDFTGRFGVAADRTLEFSLRDDVLRMTAELQDTETGQVFSPTERFQRALLADGNVSASGEVRMSFATSLVAENGVFSSGVCNNTVSGLRVRIIGDGLGDNQAAVRLVQQGTSTQRSCLAFVEGRGDEVNDYLLPPVTALLDAGVNDYRDETFDTQLFGRAVANTEWQLVIPPGGEEPQNNDLDVTKIEDIIIEMRHRGIVLGNSGLEYTPACSI